MMKYYIAPEIEVVTFHMEDILTASSGGVTPTPTPNVWVENDANSPAQYDGELKDF